MIPIFFFQAEDGIRDSSVTGVQTCALPILEALYDAADDDSATGGPDLVRGIYPTAVVLAAEGAEEVLEARIAELAREVIESRAGADTFRTSSGPSADARGDS